VARHQHARVDKTVAVSRASSSGRSRPRAPARRSAVPPEGLPPTAGVHSGNPRSSGYGSSPHVAKASGALSTVHHTRHGADARPAHYRMETSCEGSRPRWFHWTVLLPACRFGFTDTLEDASRVLLGLGVLRARAGRGHRCTTRGEPLTAASSRKTRSAHNWIPDSPRSRHSPRRLPIGHMPPTAKGLA
jgi:hypothetical protein